MTFGESLRLLQRRLTQRSLAARRDIHHTYLPKMENRRTDGRPASPPYLRWRSS